MQLSNQTKLVTTPVGDRPLRVFRATIPVSIAVNGRVDAVEIDPAQTILQGAFEAYSFNVLAASAPVTAQRSPLGAAVIITLDQPLHIQSVRLSTSTAIAANYTLAFHRLDGNTLVEKPTAIASIQNRLASLTDEFVDGRFALQLRDAGGTPVALASSNVIEVNVQSYPTTPRLGVLDESIVPASLIQIWQAPGEIGKATPLNQGNANANAALATTLQRYLNAHLNLLNTPLKLIAESDAPCQFRLNALTLLPQFVIQQFPSPDVTQPPPTKQILRFPGTEASTQIIQLTLPSHSQIINATLEIAESLRTKTVKPNEAAPTESPLLEPLTGTEGICTQTDRFIAQQVNLTEAIRVNGLALAVMAMADSTTLQVTVYEDKEGRPVGQPVAEGTLQSVSPGNPVWAIASFPKPVVLFAQPYWIVLKATNGSALWLTQSKPETVQILDDLTQFQLGQAANPLNAISGRYRWLLSIEPNLTATAQPQTPALQLAVNGQSVQGTVNNGRCRYDLTAVLNQALAIAPSSSSEIPISLTFSTASIGSITVYPAKIVYRT